MSPVHAPTLPHPQTHRVQRALSIRVVDGPDAGAALCARGERAGVGTARDNDLVLTDETVSRYHLELSIRSGAIVVEDHGSTNGTVVGSLRIERAVAEPGTVLTLGRTKLRVGDEPVLEPPLFDGHEMHGLIGRSPAMRRVMTQIDRIARSDASVLVLGETGTGKELVGRALHLASDRRDGPFEVVDCGALIPTLVASELFGHEKGSFTGADARHLGAFERANGGTIMLDEIGELSPELQVRLLGALERRSFRRVGGTSVIDVDVRVIAATHRDLRRFVNAGQFRQDLYYRLAVARLHLPALRERPDDVLVLADHFARELGSERALSELIPSGTLDSLQSYHWPGNVRELRNFVEAALAFGEPPRLESELESERTDGAHTGAPSHGSFLSASLEQLLLESYGHAREKVIREFQDFYLRRTLARANGNVSKAALLARMNRPHMVQLLKRHGIT